VASSKLSVTIGRQARQKVGPLTCRAETTDSAPFTVIILKLKEEFRHIRRPVKFKALENFPLKKQHITRKPYTSICI
jgi:hypothetical protein